MREITRMRNGEKAESGKRKAESWKLEVGSVEPRKSLNYANGKGQKVGR